MVRRLGSLAIVLVSNVAMVVTPALAGPPPPSIPQTGPIEGPFPLPKHEPPPPEIEPELDLDEGGSIEFATPPVDPHAATVGLPPVSPASMRDEIGKAPNSGAAFLAGGSWLLPVAGLATTALVVSNRASQYPPYSSEPGIITAGVGLGVIGAAMLGIGIHRTVLLSRWARRHRVVALPQGSGLVTSGTLAGLLGVIVLVVAVQARDGITGAIAGAMLVSSPIQIGVGVSFARRYARTGGWRATRYTLSPGGLRMQF